ncbi:Granulins, partial [Araneus ventricosus]
VLHSVPTYLQEK